MSATQYDTRGTATPSDDRGVYTVPTAMPALKRAVVGSSRWRIQLGGSTFSSERGRAKSEEERPSLLALRSSLLHATSLTRSNSRLNPEKNEIRHPAASVGLITPEAPTAWERLIISR